MPRPYHRICNMGKRVSHCGGAALEEFDLVFCPELALSTLVL